MSEEAKMERKERRKKWADHMWRTLVRVVRFGPEDYVTVCVPGWDSSRVLTIRLSTDVDNDEVKDAMKKGVVRFFAYVNIGAEFVSDLKFERWQLGHPDLTTTAELDLQ